MPGKKNINIVFQKCFYSLEHNVISKYCWVKKIKKLQKMLLWNKKEEMFRLVNLKGLKKDLFSLYGGQQQRIAIARVLVMNQVLLLMSFRALDLQLRKRYAS